MRFLLAPAVVTALLVAGLSGCQSCVDETPQPSQSSQSSHPEPGVLGSMPRVRPRRLGPMHVAFRDAGTAAPDDAGGPSGE